MMETRGDSQRNAKKHADADRHHADLNGNRETFGKQIRNGQILLNIIRYTKISAQHIFQVNEIARQKRLVQPIFFFNARTLFRRDLGVVE